jgi:prophage antirepressor-like protein
MNLPQVFNYADKEIRIATINNELWWVAKDVCDVLEITWSGSKTLDRISDKHKGLVNFTTPGGIQELWSIDEPGLYKLIMRSSKPEAEKFQDWVTEEVIPQIRKTGSYSLIPQSYAEALRAYADEVERREKLEVENIKMLPKAEFFDAVASSKDAIDLGAAAKVLDMGIGRNKLFELLRNKQILMQNNQPYQKFIDSGYFRVVEQKYVAGSETKISIKTLVYQKGLDFIRKLVKTA